MSTSPNDDITIETQSQTDRIAGGSSGSNVRENESRSHSPRQQTNSEPSMKDVMSVLISIQNEQKAQKTDVINLQNMVNDLYQDYENDNYDEYYDETENQEHDSGEQSGENSNVANDQDNGRASVTEDSSEPPSKRQKRTDSNNNHDNNSVFKLASNIFKVKEPVDIKVNDDLADMVNSFFREGISDEKFNELMKDIHRPENCTSLTKTRVNQLIWDLLCLQTRSYDSGIQQHQFTVVKAACNVVKLLNTLEKVKSEH